MEKNAFMKKYAPYFIAILSFVVICTLYFKPQYDDMALRQGDMVQVSGMNKDIKDHQQQYGEHPEWAGNMFGGMPSYLIDFDYQGREVGTAASPLFFLQQPASYIFIAMAGFFFMLLCFGVNPWLSMVGGIAYGLSSYFLIIIEAGHITKILALGYAPPMVGAIYLAYRGKLWLGALLAGIFASLEIGANHLQITYYFVFVTLALVINEGIRAYREKLMSRFVKTSVVLLFAAALAVGSNAILLWYVNDYSKDTIRGKSELTQDNNQPQSGLDKEYATAWSYGKMETFNLFIPNLLGGSSAGGFSDDGPVADALSQYNARGMAPQLPGYWGDQPMTLGPVYIGAVVIFLFVLGMFLLCGINKWWIFGVTALSILLAWGHNLMWFTDLFFHYFPLYNKFRVVSMFLVVAEWSLPLIAILTLQKLWDNGIPKERFNRALKYSTIITGGISLFFLIFGSMIFNFSGNADSQFPADVVAAMQTERASLLRNDAIRSLMLVLFTAAVVWAFYKGKIKRGLLVAAMTALVLIDMVGVDIRYLNYDTFVPVQKAKEIVPTQADMAIMEDKEPGYRVANFTVGTFMDATTSYFHRSVGGYHAAKLRRYQDLIDRHLLKMNMGVYNMLNTKYFIVPSDKGEPTVQLNPGRLGAAWFVEEVAFAPNADAEIAALDQFNPKTTAVVDERFKGEVGTATSFPTDSTASITLTEYKVNHLTYKYNAPAEGIAVFSEIYYPKGWTAYVDGKEAPYFRADYILRAMKLPAGEHTVEFRFKAPHYSSLVGITYASSLLLLGGLAAAIVISIVRARKKKEGITK